MSSITKRKQLIFLYGISFLIIVMIFTTNNEVAVANYDSQLKVLSISDMSKSRVETKSNPLLPASIISNDSVSSSETTTSNFTKNLSKAIQLYDIALKSYPNNPDILTNKGIVLSLLGEQKQAIVLYDIVLNIDPNHVGALFNKGKILNMTGNLTGAIFYFKQAQQIDPTYKGELINIKALALAVNELPSSICTESKPVNKQKICE